MMIELNEITIKNYKDVDFCKINFNKNNNRILGFYGKTSNKNIIIDVLMLLKNIVKQYLEHNFNTYKTFPPIIMLKRLNIKYSFFVNHIEYKVILTTNEKGEVKMLYSINGEPAKRKIKLNSNILTELVNVVNCINFEKPYDEKSLLYSIKKAFCGDIVLIENIENNINFNYLNTVLRKFYESGNGQLLFTSNNISLLDKFNDHCFYFETKNKLNKLTKIITKGNSSLSRTYERFVKIGGFKEELEGDVDETEVLINLML